MWRIRGTAIAHLALIVLVTCYSHASDLDEVVDCGKDAMAFLALQNGKVDDLHTEPHERSRDVVVDSFYSADGQGSSVLVASYSQEVRYEGTDYRLDFVPCASAFDARRTFSWTPPPMIPPPVL